MIVIAHVFPKLQTVKTCLDHSFKSAISEHTLIVNMWKCSKYFQNLNETTFIMLFIILREVDLEIDPPSVTLNLRRVC